MATNPMHILYIHQYFITPSQQGGTRSFEFARYLVSRGHHVTMVTSGLMNHEFPVDKNDRYTEYNHEGIRILSIRAGYNDALAGTGFRGSRRMVDFHRFAYLAFHVGKKVTSPDVIFTTSTPLTVGITGRQLKRHFSVPFVFEVRDLWPDALINIGALRNPLAVSYLRWMERRSYSAADHIVALSPGIKAGICRQGIPESLVSVIPNSCDLDLFHPCVDGTTERNKLGVGDRFAAVYFGAVGLANGLEYVLDAAQLLKRQQDNRIVLLIVGSGGHKPRLVDYAARLGLDNVIFHEGVPKREVAKIVAGCDACLTIFRATKELAWSPNKMFDALSAGKPVLINVGGWLGETVERNKCGYHVDAARPEALAEALQRLASDPEVSRQMGVNARALAEREFDREKLAARLENIFHRVSARNRA